MYSEEMRVRWAVDIGVRHLRHKASELRSMVVDRWLGNRQEMNEMTGVLDSALSDCTSLPPHWWQLTVQQTPGLIISFSCTVTTTVPQFRPRG